MERLQHHRNGGHISEPEESDDLPGEPPTQRSRIIDGAAFIFDQPANIPAIWGDGTQVLWAEGEACMLAGGQGLGKTTLAGQLVRALLGLTPNVLGLRVNANLLDNDKTILYLAMDRPRQIARSLARQFSPDERNNIEGRLIVWPGPPPADLAANPLLLASLSQEHNAAVVIVDSLKDAALKLSTDEVGAAYNRARQHLLQAGIQILELHHVVKFKADGAPPTITDIYGSTWLTSGAGSVVLLSGDPGDPIVAFRHLKQPAEEVGPWQLAHDQTAGQITITHSTDLVSLTLATGVDGLTARAAACALFNTDKPTAADIAKARRRLDKLTSGPNPTLHMMSGPTTNDPTVWFLAAKQGLTHPYEK